MSCTAIILAGGAGRRLDGQDKGLVPWRNKPLIEHCIDTLAPQVDDIVISCNRNLSQYQRYGFACIQDSNPATKQTYQGPLAGIASCAKEITTDWVLLCPCDTPMLPSNLYKKLHASLSEQQADITIAKVNDRLHYSHALMTTAFAKTAMQRLTHKKRSLEGWYDTGIWVNCDFSDQADAFKNFNSAEDFT